MIDDTLSYRTNESTEEDIRAHLLYCDHQFSPRLSERVDIVEYSRKIKGKAFTFEAWYRDTLVGLVAVYMNPQERSCYITSVSVVTEFSGRGIAARLLDACIERAIADSIATVSLEVQANNHPAIRLYQKFGFQVVKQCGDSLFMKHVITSSNKGK